MGNESPTSANGSASVRLYLFGETRLECSWYGRLDRLCAELKDEFPSLRMAHKRPHWYWRVLHWVVLIITFGGNREFNDVYTTTIGMFIGWSDTKWKQITEKTGDWENQVWQILQHEREHLRQFKKYGLFLMLIGYGLVFFPIGLAYVRARCERAGYLRTLQCWYVLNPRWAENKQARDWWISQFTGGAYGYMMFPFKKTVSKWFDQELKRLQAMTAEPTFS